MPKGKNREEPIELYSDDTKHTVRLDDSEYEI